VLSARSSPGTAVARATTGQKVRVTYETNASANDVSNIQPAQ
jgi:hypothetical protein